LDLADCIDIDTNNTYYISRMWGFTESGVSTRLTTLLYRVQMLARHMGLSSRHCHPWVILWPMLEREVQRSTSSTT